jgi:hypothetical protein
LTMVERLVDFEHAANVLALVLEERMGRAF